MFGRPVRPYAFLFRALPHEEGPRHVKREEGCGLHRWRRLRSSYEVPARRCIAEVGTETLGLKKHRSTAKSQGSVWPGA